MILSVLQVVSRIRKGAKTSSRSKLVLLTRVDSNNTISLIKNIANRNIAKKLIN